MICDWHGRKSHDGAWAQKRKHCCADTTVGGACTWGQTGAVQFRRNMAGFRADKHRTPLSKLVLASLFCICFAVDSSSIASWAVVSLWLWSALWPCDNVTSSNYFTAGDKNAERRRLLSRLRFSAKLTVRLQGKVCDVAQTLEGKLAQSAKNLH